MTRIGAAAIGLLITAAGCGAAPDAITAAATTTEATTTIAAPTTTTVPRSQWCLDRDDSQWPEHHPEPYDPAPVDAEKATILRRLDRSLEQQIGQANAAFGNMAENRADDPASLAEVEQARQSTIRQIRAAYRDAAAELESRLAREHREARADHDTRERERAELAALELRNEMMRYELEC